MRIHPIYKILKHHNGIDLAAKKGQIVQTAQKIGLVGSSGISSGPHLHFELRENDKPIDPATRITF